MTYCALAGLCIGSFLNVLIYRLPKMMETQWEADMREAQGLEALPAKAFNLMTPRSHCPSCKTPIRLWHNIPVLGYLLARGRCVHCKTRISLRYPAIELLTGCVFGTLAWLHPETGHAMALMGLSAALIGLAFIDLDTYLLPDVLTLPLVWAGLLVNLVFKVVPLDEAVLGAVAGYLMLWTVYHVFKLITGKEGMGYGDFKLLAAAGAWFGVGSLFSILLVSSVSGVCFGLTLQALRGKSHAEPFPFGPSLVFGTFSWMFGLDLMRWVL